jgi:hypothetical protein
MDINSAIWSASPEQISDTVSALQNAQNANPTDAEKQQLESLKRSNEIAQALWQRYQQLYKPLQDSVSSDASTVDSEGNQERAAGDANANVVASFERARQASLDRLRALGVTPSADAFIVANARFADQQAAADAGAQNTARTNLINGGRQYRINVAGLGDAIPRSAMGGYLGGAQGYWKAARDIRKGREEDNAHNQQWLAPVIGGVRDWFRGSGWNSSGYGYDASGQRGAYDNELSYDGGSGRGWSGGDVPQDDFSGGYYADGGIVHGPGRAGENSAPRAAPRRGHLLSDGQFVVPADVVKAKGTEFFRKLIETYRRGVRT